MKVLLTKNFLSSDIEYMKAGLLDNIELIKPDEFTEEGVLKKINEADALLGGMLTKPLLEAAGHIRLFQIPWTGVDTVDFKLLKEFEVDCLCNSHSGASVVGEHAVALYAAVAKKITYHDNQMRMGHWNRIDPAGNEVNPFSRPMLRQNVVFVGYGAVNRSIHDMLSGFQPVVTVVNRSGIVSGSEDNAMTVHTYADISEAMPKADVVFVALPLTPQSTGLLDEKCFAAMGENCIVVNVARGAVVDEKSLFTALDSKKIYGAGIDTWYNYPKPGDEETYPSSQYPFQQLKNIVMSPHRAGFVDTSFPHLDDAILNINNLSAGKPLVNLISADHRY